MKFMVCVRFFIVFIQTDYNNNKHFTLAHEIQLKDLFDVVILSFQNRILTKRCIWFIGTINGINNIIKTHCQTDASLNLASHIAITFQLESHRCVDKALNEMTKWCWKSCDMLWTHKIADNFHQNENETIQCKSVI